MIDLAEYVDGLPNISGSEERIRQAIQASRTTPVFLPQGASGFGEINSAFAIALHMHQPLIPAGGPELRTAQMISNLQWMLDNPDIGDNHNARVFLWCYKRMGEFVPQLLERGVPAAGHARILWHAALRIAPDGRHRRAQRPGAPHR